MINPLEEILKRTTEVSQECLRAHAEKVDQEAMWPAKSMNALMEAGLGGLVTPVETEGLGQGLYALVRVSELLGRECASTALCYGMHAVASAVIAAKATDDQKERFLIPIARGQHITTLSLSEPGSGSHFYFPETRYRETDDEQLLIHGQKSFVTSGGRADSYVVSTASQSSTSEAGRFSLVIVPKDSEGMRWKDSWDALGMRGNSSIGLDLNDVEVTKGNLLGREGDQIWYMFEVVTPYFLMAMAGTYLGIATAAIDEAVAMLKKRDYSHSGSSLSQVGVVQHRLGKIWSDLEAAKRLTYHAAQSADAGDPDSLYSLLSSKAHVGDTVTGVVNEVMTLVGGQGYSASGKLSRLLRDARAAHVMAPTTDTLRTWTGRALLGIPLLSEG